MKTSLTLTFLSFVLLGNSTYAASLSYKEISTNEFELLLQNDTRLEISHAQDMLYEPAIKICGGKKPLYGKYKFEAKEPIAGGQKNASSFYFSQKITCVDELPSTAIQAKSNLSEARKNQIETAVRQLTEKYMSAKEAGKFEVAYGMLTDSMKEISAFDAWATRESKHFGELGNFIARDVWRITIYDNPVNSPQPGIYIAADYESKYDKSSMYCGYVVWFLHPNSKSDYKVMREEFGHISNEMLKKIPSAELGGVRKQIGCKAL